MVQVAIAMIQFTLDAITEPDKTQGYIGMFVLFVAVIMIFYTGFMEMKRGF